MLDNAEENKLLKVSKELNLQRLRSEIIRVFQLENFEFHLFNQNFGRIKIDDEEYLRVEDLGK